MNAEEKYDLIEKYLHGELTGIALDDFEQALKNDPELEQELSLHQQVAESLKGEKVHELRNVLKSTDQHWQSPKSKPKAKVRSLGISKIAAIAAAILFLVFAARLFTPSSESSSQDLFAQHFEPYQMILNQRTEVPNATAIEMNINKAVAAYGDKNFEEASAAFQDLQANTPDAMVFRFYAAISELSLGNHSEAIVTLEDIQKDSLPLLSEQCNWYLALAYLQAGGKTKAKLQLEKITSGAYKYESAQQILGKL